MVRGGGCSGLSNGSRNYFHNTPVVVRGGGWFASRPHNHLGETFNPHK